MISVLATLRPFLGPSNCRFTIGCTQFAIVQLKELPLLPALQAIAKRVLSCNPFINERLCS